ncbi:ABC-type branched-chain amino acid transport system, substrate-binding protein [Nannocystis exedens]|uniref:ABC-type branched-chain amino acid transport system, substrate-binding protein n=1 Tax=Nannocystis exedens TaxID=54 RepID=A0A1I2EP83_9BACT|nr:ABC transporter substrate-binding protein [Nannocystis exedens]PCC73934.1 ABC transporter substrate-binding protein [Nannocystis exedens]SFE94050.1 ABC-type branched-chain amino acid transport system, substrate-binding protein [Nannocystis exedens]
MNSEVAVPPGEPICFGCHAPLHGNMARFGEIAVAAQALFAEVNAAGGVHGHRIVLIIGDDGYDPAETPAVVERLLVGYDVFGFLMCVGTPPHLTVIDRLTAENIPDLAVVTGASSMADAPRPNMCVANVPYHSNGRALGQHVRALARVGTITYDTAFGRDWVAGFTAGLGRAPTRSRWLGPDEAIEPAVEAMQADGMEAVLAVVRPEQEAAAILHGQRRGFRPRWLVGFVDGLTAMLGAAGEGVIGSHWLHMAEGAGSPAIAAHRELMARRAPEVEVTGTSVGGQALAELTVELLRRAGPCPTRARLLAALDGLDGRWRSPLMRVSPRKDPRRPVIFDAVALLRLTAAGWVAIEE